MSPARDVVLCAQDHGAIGFLCDSAGGIAWRAVPADRRWKLRGRKAGGGAFQRLDRGIDGPLRPDRRDQEQGVGEPVEHEQHGRPHEHHVGHAERVDGRARHGFGEAQRLVAEIADQAGERRREFSGDVGDAAALYELTQCGHRGVVGGRECGAIVRPMRVDLSAFARGPENEVRGQADQAVAAAGRAALDRFEQEVAAARLDQLERSGDRGFGIGDLRQPDQARASGGVSGARFRYAADGSHRPGQDVQGAVSGL